MFKKLAEWGNFFTARSFNILVASEKRTADSEQTLGMIETNTMHRGIRYL